MSQPNRRRGTFVGWIFSGLLIAASLLVWTERQYVVDAIAYYQYEPTAAVESLAREATLTDSAKFTFYATRPAVQSKQDFNQNCPRTDPDSPILGCYAANRIYIYDVTDERLNGIKTVTAAHEMLHAAYDRMSESERSRINELLRATYKEGENENLDSRMDYYAEAQPGQSLNELHSIIGTEFARISPELETYYAQYFQDRAALVALHQRVESQFDSLRAEAESLVSTIETLARDINQSTNEYNQSIAELNQDIKAFNARASQPDGFRSQSEFEAARQELIAQSSALDARRDRIETLLTQYRSALAKLDTINAESASLNAGLDSTTLQDAPSI